MDIADVKKELSSDEKVLENIFKIETLYKKYKFIVWIIVIGIILFVIGKNIMQSMNEKKLSEANSAFLTLQAKADDAQSLAILKEKNHALFELYTFRQAAKNKNGAALKTLTSSSNAIVADASKYTLAALEKKPSNSRVYKEMSLFSDAFLATQTGDTKSAKAKLSLISSDSSLSMLASLLKHSTIKAK